MDTLDIALRLGAATLVGIVLGLNRDLHGKPTGVRTLGILCLGSALAVLSIHAVTGTDASRVIQGIVTGVGFLGAGVIVRSEKGHHVQGLTTAACVWVTACMGAACAVADCGDRRCSRLRRSCVWRAPQKMRERAPCSFIPFRP
jgi:putative Mg2+ transporter-C (MgtC) family protein